MYYQWLRSNVNVANTLNKPFWQATPIATNATYQPDSIFQSTFYIRCSRTQACKFVGNTTESNIVSVILNPIPIATLSTLGTTTICQNDSVNIIAPPNMSSYLGFAKINKVFINKGL